MTGGGNAPGGGLRTLLGIPDFRRLWTGQIVSDFGDNLTMVTLLFLVQRLTGSTVALAGLAIVITIPSLVFGVISGVYADRLDRRRVMIVSDIARGVIVLGLLVVESASMLWLMYVLAFAQASVGTMFNPARSALLPSIVGEERLLAANSVAQTSKVVAGLAGTATAGILAGLLTDLRPAFVIDAITFFFSAAMIARIAHRPAMVEAPEVRPGVWRDLGAGLGAVRRSRGLMGILLAAAIAMLGLGAVNVLLVPFVVEDLMVAEAWFGLLEGSQVLGMVASGVAVAVLATRFRSTTLVTVGLGAIGGAIALVGGVDRVWQLMLVLLAVGLFMTPLQSAIQTLSQTLIPDELRGRIGGSLSAVVSVASVTSMGLAGVAAAALGVRTVFVISGLITITAGVVAGLIFRGTELPAPAVKAADAALG